MSNDKPKPAFRTVQTIEDLVPVNPKNLVMVPYCAAGIIQGALKKNQLHIAGVFGKLISDDPHYLSLFNAPVIAESYFGMKQNSKVVAVEGFDLDNGIDVKTCNVKPGATSACIGNTKNKQKLSVIITIEGVGIIESVKPIPTPGEADTLTISLTRNGKIWDKYIHADCFDPSDVEADDERGIGGGKEQGEGFYLNQGFLHMSFSPSSSDVGWDTMRYRCVIQPWVYDRIVNEKDFKLAASHPFESEDFLILNKNILIGNLGESIEKTFYLDVPADDFGRVKGKWSKMFPREYRI